MSNSPMPPVTFDFSRQPKAQFERFALQRYAAKFAEVAKLTAKIRDLEGNAGHHRKHGEHAPATTFEKVASEHRRKLEEAKRALVAWQQCIEHLNKPASPPAPKPVVLLPPSYLNAGQKLAWMIGAHMANTFGK